MIEKVDLTVWGRSFSLPVEYDCYKGESVTAEQQEAVKAFSASGDLLAASRKNVEEYCREDVAEDEENQKKDNIFSYVKPEFIYVKRDAKEPRVALMCRYRYDPEHGLAVVFTKGGKVTVGVQDIIL